MPPRASPGVLTGRLRQVWTGSPSGARAGAHGGAQEGSRVLGVTGGRSETRRRAGDRGSDRALRSPPGHGVPCRPRPEDPHRGRSGPPRRGPAVPPTAPAGSSGRFCRVGPAVRYGPSRGSRRGRKVTLTGPRQGRTAPVGAQFPEGRSRRPSEWCAGNAYARQWRARCRPRCAGRTRPAGPSGRRGSSSGRGSGPS